MRKITTLTLSVALAIAVTTTPARVIAQDVPPHQPGTICFTPYLWCWTPFPQPVGSYCTCPTPYGPATGSAG